MERQFSKTIFLSTVAFLFFVQSVSGGEIIGTLTDPCNLSITGYTDIISAKVEKSGLQLTFYITTRSPIPTSVPDPCSITYIWFVDADNNPQTGQNPGAIGSEFNVRAIVKPTVEGWVDTTGAWPPSGGQGTVTINGNELKVTIDMSQIGSPDLFHFRCDAGTWNGSQGENSNGLTPESAEAWASEYAVLYDVSQRYYGIDQDCTVSRCDEGDPFNPETATLAEQETWTNEGQSEPQFNKIMADDGSEYFIQSLGSSDFLHLRTLTYFDVVGAITGTFGQSECKTTTGVAFSLLGRDSQTEPVPEGLFVLNIRHECHLRASSDTGGADASTYAQIVITDITDPENIEQKMVWPAGRYVYMDKLSSVKVDSIDLAEKGMAFNRIYIIDVLLNDNPQLSQPTMNGQVATDSSLTVSIDTVLTGDLDKNRFVDFGDFTKFAENWLEEK